MAPKDQPSDKPALSEREVQLAIIAWQCIDGDVKIQLDKFARLAQYANHESARTNWARIKSKLKAIGLAYEEEASQDATGQRHGPASADATANNKEEAIDDGIGGSIKDAPKKEKKKKATGTRKRKAAADVENEQQEPDGGDADGAPAPKAAKRRPRVSKAAKPATVEAEEE